MKKRIFISYRFTGENKEELKKTIIGIHNSLEKAGHNHYSTIFETEQFANEKWSGKQIMEKAFKEIDNSDVVLFFVKKEDISQGMLVELGYSLAMKKKIILAINKNIKESIFRRQIDKIIDFDNLDDLNDKLIKLKL
jgi:nucleoside 2-deoxyribosyltransferase